MMGRVNEEECCVSRPMRAYVITRSGVRKGEGADFIGQLLKSSCIVGFQRLNRFPC
jgi:hypothetical protein